jgi:anti-sigma B factor antagonist
MLGAESSETELEKRAEPMNDDCVDVSITSVAGCIMITLVGEVDAHTTPGLQRTLDHLLDPRMRIAVDLSGVRFIDSRGLQVLLLQTMRFRESGGRFGITNASAWVQRVVGYAGLSGALDTVDGQPVGPTVQSFEAVGSVA